MFFFVWASCVLWVMVFQRVIKRVKVFALADLLVHFEFIIFSEKTAVALILDKIDRELPMIGFSLLW